MPEVVSEPKGDQGRSDAQKRPYTAYGAAKQLWACKAEEILIEGPAGTGKTRAILEKMHFCAMKYSHFRGLIVRKTRESLTDTVLVTLEEKVIPADSSILTGPKRNLRSEYRYPNGSVIVIGGMDKPQKVMSSEYDMVGTFESTELSEEDFEALTTRLRNHQMPYQQIISDCNPGPPRHWLNRRPDKTGMARLLSRHEDNPVLFDQRTKVWTEQGKKYLAKLDRLSGPRKLRLRFGKWVEAEGIVYENFDPAIHVIDRFRMPVGTRLIRSIDLGYVNPFVCQWWAIDPDGVMYLWREIYYSGRIVEEHATTIHLKSLGKTYEANICDHDREDRATLERYGITTVPAYKDIERGIQAVEARLALQKNGKPRLFMFRDTLVERDEKLVAQNLPAHTREEFDSYVWRKNQDGKTIKEEPVDRDNHGMDAMRYAVAYVDRLGSYSVTLSTDEPVAVSA